MYFRGLIAGAVVILGFGLSSCGLYEGPPKDKEKKFNNEEMKCLNHFKTRLQDYFKGLGDEAEIDRLTQCLNLSLDNFVKYTRGEHKDRFTAQEVRNFLQHYILEEFEMTDGLVRELMLLKKVFIGGKDTDFTLSDIETGKNLIKDIATLLKKLHPHLPLLFDKLIENPDSRSLNLATAAYIDVANSLGDIIQNKNAQYSFADLNRLISEFEIVFPDIEVFKTMKKDLPQVVRMKNKLVTPFKQNYDVTAEQWKTVLNDGAEWMAIYLKFKHLTKHNEDLTRGKARVRLVEIFDDAVVLTDRVINRHDGTLSFAAIEDFLDEFGYDGTFFGAKLSTKTVKDALKPIVKRVLSGADTSENGRLAMGLKRSHLNKLQMIFHEWSELMNVTEALFAKQSGSEGFAPALQYTNDALLSVDLNDFIKDSVNPRLTGKMAAEVASLIVKYPSFVVGESNQFLFSNDVMTRGKSFHDMTRWTWLRPIFKYLMMGYMSPERAKRANPEKIDREGLTLSEFKIFIHDLWPALVDLKRVGTRFNNPEDDSKKRFLEGSLFMFASDGDARASVDEGLQLILYMISADKIGDLAHRSAAQSCKTGERDEFSKFKVEPKCYEKVMYDFDSKTAPLKDLWAAFPRWVKYYSRLNAEQRKEYKTLLRQICRRAEKPKNEWMGSDDTDALVMLMHYVETLFARYDTDFSETLNPKEAQKSWTLFKRTLSEIPDAPEDAEQLEAVFAYILAHGEPPEFRDSWFGKKWDEFVFWKDWLRTYQKDWSGYNFESDRSKILLVFDKIKPKKPEPVKN